MPTKPRKKRKIPILAALIALVSLVSIVVSVTTGDGRRTLTVTITPHMLSIPAKVDADRSADDEPSGPSVAAHEDLRDEHPAGVPAEKVDAGLEQTTAPGLTAPSYVGGAQNYSCVYRPVVNKSGRNGQKVLLFVVHLTVSPPGSMQGVWRLFNTPSFSASSTWLLEQSGACLRLMRNREKPWTQGNFNGRSISVEIIATGRETRAQWLAMPIIKHGILASLMRDNMRAEGLPLRLVDPVGCGVQKAGWTDHARLECGNDHTDVMPNFPYDVVQKQLVAWNQVAVAAASERGKTCKRLVYHRAKLKALPAPARRSREQAASAASQVSQIQALKKNARKIGLNPDSERCKA